MELLIIELLGRWKMKKLTVRIEDYVYDRLFLVAKDNSTSTNKIINAIIEKYIKLGGFTAAVVSHKTYLIAFVNCE